MNILHSLNDQFDVMDNSTNISKSLNLKIINNKASCVPQSDDVGIEILPRIDEFKSCRVHARS